MTTIKGPTQVAPTQTTAVEQTPAQVPAAPVASVTDGFDSVKPALDVIGAPSHNDRAQAQLERQLKTAAAAAAEVFPQPMRAAVHEALEVSIARIGTAKAAGNIDASEASQAAEMVRELFEGLADLRAGKAEVHVKPNDHDRVRVWRLKSADGDEFQVTARRKLDEFGEARIGFRQVLDDGRPLPGRHRVGLRVDLERFGQASVDMQFGGSSLDKRIHGLMKNPDGTVFETASGKKLADHHFRNQLPDSIEDPAVFARLVDAFASGVMKPLEAVP